MTIAATVEGFHTFPFPSNDDRFPTLRWESSGRATGDATGGGVLITLQLRPALQPPSGLVFGVDSLHAFENAASPTADVAVRAANFKLSPPQDVQNAISFPLTSITAFGRLSNALAVNTILGNAGDLANNSHLLFSFSTNINTVLYVVYATGFIWQSKALYEGGPLFPGQFPTP